MNTVKGDFELLKSAVSGVALSFGDALEPKLRSAMGALTEMVSGFGDMSQWSKTALIDITLLGAGTGIALKAFGTGAANVSKFLKAVSDPDGSIVKMATSLGMNVTQLGLWTAGIGLAVGAVGGLIYWAATADERLAEFNANLTAQVVESQRKIAESQDNIVQAQEALVKIQELENEIANTTGKDALAQKEEELLNYKKELLQLFPGLKDGYATEEDAIRNMTSALGDYIEEQEKSIKLEQNKLRTNALEFFNKKENKDIDAEIKQTAESQRIIDQLNETKKQLSELDGNMLMDFVDNYGNLNKNIKVSDVIDVINKDLQKHGEIITDNSELVDQYITHYEGLKSIGDPVTDQMTETYEALKKLKDGTYELGEEYNTYKKQFDTESAHYSDAELNKIAQSFKDRIQGYNDLSEASISCFDTMTEQLKNHEIEVEDFNNVTNGYLSAVRDDYGNLSEGANASLDKLLQAYTNQEISAEEFSGAISAMSKFTVEEFGNLSEASQTTLTAMLDGMAKGTIQAQDFGVGVDAYLAVASNSFEKMTDAEKQMFQSLTDGFIDGDIKGQEFALAMGSMQLLTSDHFQNLDNDAKSAIASMVAKFNEGDMTISEFAIGVGEYMGLSQQSINQLASLSATDIQSLMDSFASGKLSAEQLQQAIDLMKNNPQLPVDIAVDMATIQSAMQETEKERDELQGKIDTMKGNNKWSSEFSGEIEAVITELTEGKLSGDKLQERINTLKNNPTFKQYMTSDLEEIIGGLSENKKKGDDLQSRIDTLKNNPGWTSKMSGDLDKVSGSASKNYQETSTVQKTIDNLKNNQNFATNQTKNFNDVGSSAETSKGKVDNLRTSTEKLKDKKFTITTIFTKVGEWVGNMFGAQPSPGSFDGINNNTPVYSPPDYPTPTEPTPSGDANVPMMVAKDSIEAPSESDYGIATAASVRSSSGLSFDTSKNYDNLSEEEKKLQQERERLESAANSAIEKLRNKLYQALKKKIEKQKQDELSIYDARIEAIKKEMALLDESVSTSTEDTLESERSKLEKLQAELTKWEQNNSAFATSKVNELKEAILEQEEAVKKAEVEFKKEQLQAQIDLIEEEQDAVSEKYDQLLTEEYLYTEANKILLNQSMAEMLQLIEEFIPDFSDIGLLLGQSLADGIMESISQGLDGFNYLKNADNLINNSTSSGSTSSDTNSSGGSTSSGNNTNIEAVVDEIVNEIVKEETPKSSKGKVTATNLNVREGAGTNNKVIGSVYKNEEVDILGEKDGWYNIQYWSDVYKKNRQGWVSGQYLQRFNTGGLVGSWNDGQPRMAMVDTKERVLSAEQTKTFDDLVYKFLPQFASMVKSLNNIGTTDNSGNSNVTFNNNYEVTNKTEFDVKNNMETMEYRQKQQLRRAGVI